MDELSGVNENSVSASGRMTDFVLANKKFQSCVKNAAGHVAAAKLLRQAGHNNLAFNAAVLALEEVGKAVLIGMNARGSVRDASEPINEDWLEDHTKKLFWVLWSTTFGRRRDTLQDFQDFPHVANRIHLRRIRAIYVDPVSGELPEQLPDTEVDRMISLAEFALEKEHATVLQEVDSKDRPDFEWFMNACDDPKLGGVIFGKESFTKLESFNGDVKEWVRWLRQEISRLEEYNQRLAEEELSRVPPRGADALRPKWRLRVRLSSMSHSVRGKSLSGWNKSSHFVKLAAARDHTELIAEFFLPNEVPFEELWTVGSALSTTFVVALNVATRGYFWWYLPSKPAEYFEEIRDLERDVPLAIDSPGLTARWGNHVLGEAELGETSRVFAYLRRLPPEKGEPYVIYRKALALIAKNDIHERFEAMILTLFYQAFRACAQQNGWWDGKTAFLNAARAVLAVLVDRLESVNRELPRLAELGEKVLGGTHMPDVPLRDAVLMKLFCDLCMSRAAHEALGFKI